MRRSSMRRGSAVLLSILPLLAPAYALPIMGNEATVVAHMNAERDAAPVPAFADEDSAVFSNLASEGSGAWLPSKRQSSASDTVSLEDDSESEPASSSYGQARPQAGAPAAPAAGPSYSSALGNIGSYGPSMRLGTAKKRALEERKADPIVTLDFDYVPPVIYNLAGNEPNEEQGNAAAQANAARANPAFV
ncbi:MAG: hypothetical protein Q9168_006661 [Polycauliona sp. 1 TL-2023]